MSDLLYSTDDLRSRLSLGGTSGDDYESVLLQACRASTRRVHAYCGQRFTQVTATRRYATVPPGIMTICIDPYVSLTSLALNTTGASSDYDTVYSSADIKAKFEKSRTGDFVTDWLDEDILPWNCLTRCDGQLWPIWVPFTDNARIKVTGVFGLPAVPEDVSEATGMLAAQLYKIRDSPLGVAGVADLGLVTIRQMPYAASLLANYRTTRAIGV